MGIVLSNFAESTIANVGGISSSDTSVSVQSGHGALFPSLSGSDHTYLTLVDSLGNREIVKATARATDTFTIERAQDGTTARVFAQGDVVDLRVCAVILEEIRDILSTALLDEDDMSSDSAADPASQQSIKAYVDNNVGAAPFNSNGNPNISEAIFAAFQTLTHVTWETVGPTGSGATRIWTALDSVDVGSDWVEVSVKLYCDGTATSSTVHRALFYATAGDSTRSISNGNEIAAIHSFATGSGAYVVGDQYVTRKIPLDSSRRIRAYWLGDYPGTQWCYLYLTDYGKFR